MASLFRKIIFFAFLIPFFLPFALQSQEIRITDDPADQYEPNIDGDRIVYTDLRNGSADIYMYDLSTGLESRITGGPFDQTSPRIHGDLIVYEDNRNGDQDIYMFDLSTMTESVVAGNSAWQEQPDVSDKWVVWVDWRNNDKCAPGQYYYYVRPMLYKYNLATGEEAPVENYNWRRYCLDPPFLEGDTLVWMRDESLYQDTCDPGGDFPPLISPDLSVYLSNLANDTHVELKYLGGTSGSAKIKGSRVLFSIYDWESKEYNLYKTDLPDTESFPITSGEIGLGTRFSFDGDLVAYLTNEWYYPPGEIRGSWRYYLNTYDISSDTKARIVSEPVTGKTPAGETPSISGNRIVYTADRHGNLDVFMYEIPGARIFSSGEEASAEDTFCGAATGPFSAAAFILPVLIGLALATGARRRKSGP